MIRLIIAGPRDYYDQEKVFRDFKGSLESMRLYPAEHLE